MLLRNDDLDAIRFRLDFVAAMIEDLHWLGFTWQEPMRAQSTRRDRYRAALQRLHEANLIYPCTRSRRDVLEAAGAPMKAAPTTSRSIRRNFVRCSRRRFRRSNPRFA